MLPLPNILFVILIAILTGYLTFLTTKGKLTDNRYTNQWSRLTIRGKKVFFTLFFIAIFLCLQEYNNNISSDIKDSFIRRENNTRDSITAEKIKVGVDANSRKLFNDVSEAFAKQGLKLDTLKKNVEKLKDSIKGSVNIYNGVDSFLSLCKEEPITLTSKSLSGYIFELKICNSSAPSRNLNAKVYVVSIDSTNKMIFSKEFELFQSNAQLDKDALITQQIIVPSDRDIKLCYFLIKGSWTNVDKSKRFLIDHIFHYNIENKRTGGVTAIHDREIRKFLKSFIGI